MIDIGQIGVPAFSAARRQDGSFIYTAVNAAMDAWLGGRAASLIGQTPHEAFDAETANRLLDCYRQCVSRRQLVEYETQAVTLIGPISWQASLVPVIGPDGAVDSLIGCCREVSDMRRLEVELRAANSQLDLAIRCLRGADWRFDVGQNRFNASPNIALLMGEAAPRTVPWSEWQARILEEDRVVASCDSLVDSDMDRQVVRFRFRDNDNRTRWAQCRRIKDTGQVPAPFICGVITDITDERQREMQLEAEASRDSLTGLLNRRGFRAAMDETARRPGPDGGTALIMLDLDGFKPINDTFGHAAGDAVLVEVASRLLEAVGPAPAVTRLGGDEFAILAAGLGEAAAMQLVAEIRQLLQRPFRYADNAIRIDGSVGLCWRAGLEQLSGMLAAADETLYADKRARRARGERANRAVPLAPRLAG